MHPIALIGQALLAILLRPGIAMTRSFAGFTLILLSGVAVAMDTNAANRFANLAGGMLMALTGIVVARLLELRCTPRWRWLIPVSFAWGLAWWVGVGLTEIQDRVRNLYEYPVSVAFIAASGLLCALLGRVLRWRVARFASLLMLPALVILAATGSQHPFESSAALPWIAAAAAHLFILRVFPASAVWVRLWHVAGVLVAAGLIVAELHWVVGVQTWTNATVNLALVTVALVSGWGYKVIEWPLAAERKAYRYAAAALLVVSLAWLVKASVSGGGDPMPYSYIPVFNPYDISVLLTLIVSALWIRQLSDTQACVTMYSRWIWQALAVAAVVLTTLAVIRNVYQVTGIAWSWSALLRSIEVRSAVLVYWGLLGVIGAVAGRHRLRSK